MNLKSLAKVFVEFVGTAVLVLSVLAINRYGIPLFTAIVAGVTLGAMVVAFGGVSGGYFNPAITAGQLMLRKINLPHAVAYVVAQGLGGVASWQLFEWFSGKDLVNRATESFDWKIFLAEALGAFVFAACVAAASSRKEEGVNAGLLIGSGLFIGATIASLASTGLLNPALALGLRSFSLEYAFGPILGAVVGMGVYEMYLSDKRMAALKSTAKSESVVSAVKRVAKKSSAKKRPAARKRK